MLLHRFLILQKLPDGMGFRDIPSLLDPRSLVQPFFPSLQVREFIDINTSPTSGGNPTPG